MKQKTLRRAIIAAVLMTVPLLGVAGLEAVITGIDGKVEVRLSEGGEWTPAETGQSVPTGATISTSFQSTAEITIGESRLEVEALTRMRIDELIEESDTDRTDLHLQVGRVDAEVRSSENRDTEFRVSSPIAVAAVRGTDFSFDGANLEVSDGIVSLSNRYNETVSVGGGESSTTTGTEPPATPAEQSESSTRVTVSTDDEGEEETTAPSGPSTGGLTINWEFDTGR
ncbi:MAG: FecR domain-containing protein [Alkalispirochaeta sp.]